MKTRLRFSLPPLSPSEALALSRILDRLDNLLWRHFGHEMTRLLDPDPDTWPDSAACDSDSEQPAVRQRER
jgi:hypothetical protein